MKLHFQMPFFSLSLKPSSLKLPVDRMRTTARFTKMKIARAKLLFYIKWASFLVIVVSLFTLSEGL